MSSSGFGPFFGFGVGVLLVLRRRWTAAALAVVPQALAWSWWWLEWGDDPAGDAGNAGPRFVVSFVKFGFWSTFGSLTGSGIFAWSAVLLAFAMIVWPRTSAAQRAPMIALLATAAVMYAGIGVRREAFGPFAAAVAPVPVRRRDARRARCSLSGSTRRAGSHPGRSGSPGCCSCSR